MEGDKVVMGDPLVPHWGKPYCLCHLLKQPVLCFSEVFKLCETENFNFAMYFMIDKHSYEQVHLKVEHKCFLYEFS